MVKNNFKFILTLLGKENEFPSALKLEKEDSFRNKIKLETFTDELKGEIMLEFAALKSKSYGYKTNTIFSNEETEKIWIKKKEINLENMKNKLLYPIITKNDYRINGQIKSDKHDIFLLQQNKKAFDQFDDKRFYINNIESKPYGY